MQSKRIQANSRARRGLSVVVHQRPKSNSAVRYRSSDPKQRIDIHTTSVRSTTIVALAERRPCGRLPDRSGGPASHSSSFDQHHHHPLALHCRLVPRQHADDHCRMAGEITRRSSTA